MIEKFKNKDYKIKNHLNCFPSLSSIRFNVLMSMIHYQTSKMDNPEVITTIENFFVESIKKRAKSDIFAENSNIELSKKELNELLSKRSLNKPSIQESRELGKILVALASLTHGLYNDWTTDYNYEISGPYQFGPKTLFIRNFPDNKPIDLWKNLDWHFHNVSIITLYQNLDAKIAFVGCHITYSSNTVENLIGYNLQIDGREIKGIKSLLKIEKEMLSIAARQYETYMNMNFEDQKIKYLFQEGYQFKKLFELVEMDWRPSQEMIERVKNKKLIENIFPTYDLSYNQFKEVFGGNKLISAYKKVKAK